MSEICGSWLVGSGRRVRLGCIVAYALIDDDETAEVWVHGDPESFVFPADVVKLLDQHFCVYPTPGGDK